MVHPGAKLVAVPGGRVALARGLTTQQQLPPDSPAAEGDGRPSIGVVIATFDQGRFIERALGSILSQCLPDDRIVVVDDGSTDDTLAILAPYEALGVRVVAQTNHGVAHARNAGAACLDTDYVLFLDADDAIAPGGLATLRAEARRTPSADIVHGDWAYVSESTGRRMAMDGRVRRPELETLVLNNPMAIHSAMVRQDTWRASGGFLEGWRTIEDLELWFRLAASGATFAHVSAVVAEYHWRPDGRSSTGDQRGESPTTLMAWMWSRQDLPLRLRRLEPRSHASAHVQQCVQYLRASRRDEAADELSAAHGAWPPILAQRDTYFRVLHARQLDAVLAGIQDGTDGDGTGASHDDLRFLVGSLERRGLMGRRARAALWSAEALALRLQDRNREAATALLAAAAADLRYLVRPTFVRSLFGAWLRS